MFQISQRYCNAGRKLNMTCHSNIVNQQVGNLVSTLSYLYSKAVILSSDTRLVVVVTYKLFVACCKLHYGKCGLIHTGD